MMTNRHWPWPVLPSFSLALFLPLPSPRPAGQCISNNSYRIRNTFQKIWTSCPHRRQGNIQLNLVHPPRRHPPVPENKVSGNKLSIGHLVAKKAG